MIKDTFVKDIFRIVDTKDGASLAAIMTEDGLFRFANIPGVRGRKNITEFLDGFFQSIKAISHSDIEDWITDNMRFAIGNVTYTRHDASSLTVPFSVALRMEEELIDEYLIFVDTSELYR